MNKATSYSSIFWITPTAQFSIEDQEFDGEPALIIQSEIDGQGQTVEGSEQVIEPEQPDEMKLTRVNLCLCQN
jgi:hypothetical protein